jgi:molybdate transport system substrate-binding protein
MRKDGEKWHCASLAVIFCLVWAAPRAGAQPVTVFAAASLTEVFSALGRDLSKQSPPLRVDFNFAGSQQLALQLEQGARADVFASADERWMEKVAARGLLEGRGKIFARNGLVVILPHGNPAGIETLLDLARHGIKVVLAADAVPAGRYARTVLQRLSGAPHFPVDYEQRVLANVVSEEQDVKAVLGKVLLGEADAGVVYRSDTAGSVGKRLRVIEIPLPYDAVATYWIAVLAAAPHAEAAARFVAALSSPSARHSFAAAGFELAAVP